MENIKFIGAQNEIQKIYSDLGLIVPVGDLDNGKAPAIQPLPATSTQTSVTAKFNVMSGADISALTYTVNDGEAVSITPQKGVVTITLSDLEYNSGPYEIELTATNETGSTVTSSTVALQHYTNWATADEVLDGNKFIGEDGQEHTGEIETKDSTDLTVNERTVTVPAGYYAENASASVSSDYIIPTGSTSITNNGTDINIAQYATVNVAVPASAVVSGTLPITQNGTGIDVTNYAAVNVAVPSGPSTGGAVISSVELVNDGGYECVVTFDTMPTLDTANHIYAVDLIAYCVEQSGVFADQTYHYNNMTTIPLNTCIIDSTLNTITFFDVNAPLDGTGNILPSTQGYILIYEDGYDNLVYKIPCTITNRE